MSEIFHQLCSTFSGGKLNPSHSISNCPIRVVDYYVMPALDLAGPALSIFSRRESSLDCFRFDSLDFLYGMTERMPVMRRGHGLPPLFLRPNLKPLALN